MRHLPDKCWLSAIGASTSATSSLRNHDIFGEGVNVAARLEALAVSGRICVSRRVRCLPRPGSWMIWLQRVLGLALLGTAAWLLFVLSLEAGAEISLIVGGMLVLLLAALAWRRRLPTGRRERGSIGAAALVLAALAILVPSLHGQAVSIEPARSQDDAGQWQPFDEASLHRMVSSGKTVLVDVTAAWCLTCKANELAVLGQPPVVDRLHDPNVIAMRADWTRPDPIITTYLQSFGRYGVPLDAVYGPGAPQGIALPELLTTEVVMEAFRRAAGAGTGKQEAHE
jgi:suppressor for copper-sensitivity B